ncbi:MULTISPECIES: N-acetylmuramoyl-L-alanine amidase CwlD [Thermoactinomyces]|jgi:N-acetylmuramoyl-L-alanine amidase|uniref:N-acetylmuramoyl-L-alanine amidase CwlD n=1 Tax=Thermoactinomyces daqus TaxID=1329516 RepID=A0A7W1X908_9BACL|nr:MULTISPECIES: N-acetylmuramoyl-L-alanine amidase CwlD [Thermoactinomyces]MBA4542320.1 N-acetylmuramoyl-L-alanine amidase CwlD [Thermoactinomyces daqus]MBH8604878.1 N-acetylmuramoyl-L-alanine amidase CwlD [Thermoactinomyces sp. CICC 10522]MBH8607296.1 N-acetylmuramoyl-L-alanine amidase CwlD [Thermoactinomyces sp. CICC 10521]
MRVKIKESRTAKIVLLAVVFFLIGFLWIADFFSDQVKDAWYMPLSGKVIMIDAGHGGPDGGAVSQDGIVEKEITLKIARYLQDYLHGAGALVFLTRETDTDLAQPDTKRLRLRKAEDLMRRIYLIKEKNVDAFVSIHLNAIPSSRWSGAQTFYNPVREENKRLATFIQAELIRNLENTNRLAKQKGDVYILKHSPVPTALVEVGFLSNPEEARLLATDTYQKKVAASIYLGLIRFYTGKEPPPLFDK